MKLRVVLKCLAIGALSMGVRTAHAATAWNEASNGDLSNDGLSPTAVVVHPGSNVVIGTTGNSGQGVDRDYFKFTVPPGSTLSAINLLPNTSVSGSVSFIGIQPGPQLTVTPTGGGADQLVAQGHYGNDQIGTNLLPGIKLGPPGPLPAGTYSIWVQDTGGAASYGFDFVLSTPAAAPSLSGWGLAFLGALLGLISWLKITRSVRIAAVS
jgi:hypothetical protein